ncbi:VOC family protein [Kockiozyma suomiensis]|uniref:VOC family protein n=1 Tax=Kockiozyma suomiensis TaxID=1337062 RepID=UPI003342F081
MPLFDHFRLFVSDYAAARSFYDPILSLIGYQVVHPNNDAKFAIYQSKDSSGVLIISPAEEGRLLAPLHFAFSAPSVEIIQEFHKLALSLGAKDNGKPGIRAEYAPNYYGAFVVDFDGNNVEFVTHT